jgi:ubiquinone/menaquinone biosynthesis C-methylase UbiE
VNSQSQTEAPPSGATTVCKESHAGRQFGRPVGWAGWWVGRLMAVKNAAMNRAAVELLDVQPGDAVLEIGFGPGRAIELIAPRLTSGYVAGVDHSLVMLRQAARRNHKMMARGRVELRRASVAALPYETGCYNKVFEVNTLHHWPAPQDNLQEVRRVMAPGGLLLLSLRMSHPAPRRFAAPGYGESEIEAVEALLRRAGFHDVQRQRRHAGREVTYLLARR